MNKADLPASPFRTDDWPGVTANRTQTDALQSDSKPTYRVRHVTAAQIELDGRLDESVWSQANVESQFTFPWNRQHAPRTEFRAVFDDQYLYFGFDVQDADVFLLDKLQDKRDEVFEDRVEIYLSRDDAMKDYYCFEIDPRGRVLDYRASFPRRIDMSWRSGGRGQGCSDPGRLLRRRSDLHVEPGGARVRTGRARIKDSSRPLPRRIQP